MRMTVQLLQDGGASEYMYHDITAWRCAFFVGKKYGCSKGYPQRNVAHTGSISLWISFAASIFFGHKKTHNATLFYRGTCIQGRRHLVTAATSVKSCAYRSLFVTIKLDSASIYR
jgi:hypothetical protein